MIFVEGFLPGGVGGSSGFIRDCSFVKYDRSVVRTVLGIVVMWLVVGSRIVERLGWCLTLGCRSAAVLRLWWYFFGLFLYRTSSFCGGRLGVCY